MPYQILPHTADVRLKVEGKDLPELFYSALLGMSEIIKNDFCKSFSKFSESISVSLSSPDETALLVDFLSEVLTQTHEKQTVFCRVEFSKLTTTELEVRLSGSKVTDGFDEDIKAVTYHEADVVKNEQGNYETVIVFDI